MAQDDWRLRIELEEEGHAAEILDRLGFDLSSEAKELSRHLEAQKLAVSRDGKVVFVYAPTRTEIERAKEVVDAELRDLGVEAQESGIEHWLADEDRWDDEPPGPDVEEELLEHGYAPWEVRVECASLGKARELARELRDEGYGVSRTFTYVIVGTETRGQAVELARRVHGHVEPGG